MINFKYQIKLQSSTVILSYQNLDDYVNVPVVVSEAAWLLVLEGLAGSFGLLTWVITAEGSLIRLTLTIKNSVIFYSFLETDWTMR